MKKIQFKTEKELIDFEDAFYAHTEWLGGNCTWRYKEFIFESRNTLKEIEIEIAKRFNGEPINLK